MSLKTVSYIPRGMCRGGWGSGGGAVVLSGVVGEGGMETGGWGCIRIVLY